MDLQDMVSFPALGDGADLDEVVQTVANTLVQAVPENFDSVWVDVEITYDEDVDKENNKTYKPVVYTRKYWYTVKGEDEKKSFGVRDTAGVLKLLQKLMEAETRRNITEKGGGEASAEAKSKLKEFTFLLNSDGSFKLLNMKYLEE
jgi:hypothetical protein